MDELFYSAWAATLCILIILGIQEEKDKSRDWWWLPLDTLCSGVAVIGLLAYKISVLSDYLGKLLLPLAIFALTEILVSAHLEIKNMEPEEDLSEEENQILMFIGASIVLCIFGGALGLGILRGFSAWS